MQGKSVLVADDEPHIRFVLELKLRSAGFTVRTACNGEQAFEMACRERPDLVVSDDCMPGGDGLELCRRLRSNAGTASVPVLMLSGRGFRISGSDMAQTNIRLVMDKPFSPKRVVESVNELLGEPAGSMGPGGMGQRS